MLMKIGDNLELTDIGGDKIKLINYTGTGFKEAEVKLDGLYEDKEDGTFERIDPQTYPLSEIQIMFSLDSEREELKLVLVSNCKDRLAPEEVTKSYPALIEERDKKLLDTKDRRERMKLAKDYLKRIIDMEYHYIKKEDKIRTELPCELLSITELTPRTWIENYLIAHPESTKNISDYEDECFILDGGKCEYFRCKKCGEVIGLYDTMIEVIYDIYDLGEDWCIRYHKDCFPKEKY